MKDELTSLMQRTEALGQGSIWHLPRWWRFVMNGWIIETAGHNLHSSAMRPVSADRPEITDRADHFTR